MASAVEKEQIMKEGIHPDYREVCFVDMSNGFKFVTRSCANTKETVKMDDGRELPSTNWTLPVSRTLSTPEHKNPWTTWVDAWNVSATNTVKRLPSKPFRILHKGQPVFGAAFFFIACSF